MFAICFLFLFLYKAFEDYSYYSVYSKDELAEFFSLKETLIYNAWQSLHFCTLQMIVFIPSLIILEITNMKKIYKILIAIAITFIASIIYVFMNFSLTF